MCGDGFEDVVLPVTLCRLHHRTSASPRLQKSRVALPQLRIWPEIKIDGERRRGTSYFFI